MSISKEMLEKCQFARLGEDISIFAGSTTAFMLLFCFFRKMSLSSLKFSFLNPSLRKVNTKLQCKCDANISTVVRLEVAINIEPDGWMCAESQ